MQLKNKSIKSSVCPLCSSNSYKILYEITIKMGIEHLGVDPVSERGSKLKSIIEELWERDVCDFVQCERCSFVYANPFKAGTEKFYSLAYQTNISYYDWKWEYQITYNEMESLIKKNNYQNIRLLEVGAGNGAFIKKISPGLIPKEKIICTELSDYGRNEIIKYGIRCVSEDLRNLGTDQFSEKFDIICMFQVLEHMDGVKEIFESFSKLSNDKARLYIAVPNNKHREFYDAHESYFDIPPMHISRWNIQSFKTAGEKYGWIVLKHAYQPQKILEKLRRFMYNRYHHFKKISYRIDQINSPVFNKLLKLTTFAIFFTIYFYSIIKLSFGHFGISQWICFMKDSKSK